MSKVFRHKIDETLHNMDISPHPLCGSLKTTDRAFITKDIRSAFRSGIENAQPLGFHAD